MRVTFILLVLGLILPGCDRGEKARQSALQDPFGPLQEDVTSGQGAHSSGSSTSPRSVAEDVSGIVASGNQFALDLYQQLRAEEGNLFYSPSSILTALAMTYAGAAGQTRAEMAEILRFQQPDETLHDDMLALQRFWQMPGTASRIRLKLANRLWGQDNYEFLTPFIEVTRDKYGAELGRLDFTQTEASRQTINRWIEAQTENKITDLMPAGTISPDTKLVLTNAVYFHGTWADPFPEGRTRDQDFHLSAADKISVPMMHHAGEFSYGAVDDLQILELPYGDGGLSMVVLLPKNIDGLADLESKLTWPNLRRWLEEVAHEDEVRVSLPRFKTTSQFEMSGVLGAMGMKSAFDPEAADFSGIADDQALFIAAVVHKAYVDVNETGTEAAAATGASGMKGEERVGKPPPVFRADHPFVFIIRDNRNAAMLFVGRIINPRT